MPNTYAICKACGDTGKASSGGDCYPCSANGRLGRRRYVVGVRITRGALEVVAGPSYDVNALRAHVPAAQHPTFIVLLGDKPKPVARWHQGRWQRKKRKTKA